MGISASQLPNRFRAQGVHGAARPPGVFLVACVVALLGCSGARSEPIRRHAEVVASKEDIAPEAATGTRRGLQSVVGERMMVSAANPHASAAGQEILRAGGSAVDAAVAMALMLTLVEPQSSGIGGGAFMLRYDATSHEVVAYDGRETAPAAATPDMFLKGGAPLAFMDAVIGGLSVGVPGELRMLELAHEAHGKLPWERLFEPAIKLAENGFALSPRLHALLAQATQLARMPGPARYFFGSDGAPKPVGTLVKNPALAAALRQIAAGGARVFYEGALAADTVRAVTSAANPGRLAASDLAGYQAKKRAAICRPFRAYRVCGMPPPTSGGITTLQILGLLERFDARSHRLGSPEEVHLFAEAGKLAFADRDQYIGDPDFVDVPVDGLLDSNYLAERSLQIVAHRAMPKATAGELPASQAWAPDTSEERPSTSHMVVVDAEGHAVSMTASIEGAFGSHLMVHGFLLNNELTDFSFVPAVDGVPVRNRVQPNKRPRSSMAPFIVLDGAGELVLVVGSPGGSRIIGYVARVLWALLEHQQDIQEAMNAPNFQNRNGATELEDVPGSWAATTRTALEGWGHDVQVVPLNSGLTGIVRAGRGWRGGTDPRREGVVLAD